MEAKKKRGRRALFTEPEELQKAVDNYFDRCAGKWLVDQHGQYVMDKNGRPILVDAYPPTITGLALALGFSSRKSLLDYQRRPRFMDIIVTAKSRVERYAEESLFDKDRLPGAKFSLICNFGWTQQHESPKPSRCIELRGL